MATQDTDKSFDLDAYLRGLMGPVVRFGSKAIWGREVPPNIGYQGWPGQHLQNVTNARHND